MSPKLNCKDKAETNAIVLDYLQYGYSDDKRPLIQREPIIIAIGTDQFKLLELIAKKDRVINLHDSVYIGNGERPVIERVKGRMSYKDLTPLAKSELESAIMEIIAANEPRFVQFYNTAQYFTLTKHMLHLLPGFSTPKLTAFLAERQKKPFESFADMNARVKSMKTPEKYICDRILLELESKQKQTLFTAS